MFVLSLVAIGLGSALLAGGAASGGEAFTGNCAEQRFKQKTIPEPEKTKRNFKMNTHSFDPQTDEIYDSLVLPEIYLTAEQVEKGFEGIACSSREDFTAMSFIRQIETIHRKCCLGEISAKERSRIRRELDDRFLHEFGGWLYQSRVAQEFYRRFNPEED